jgi:hypothetical protein
MNEYNNGVGVAYRGTASTKAFTEPDLIVGDLDEPGHSSPQLFQPRGMSLKKNNKETLL